MDCDSEQFTLCLTLDCSLTSTGHACLHIFIFVDIFVLYIIIVYDIVASYDNSIFKLCRVVTTKW